MEEPDPIAIENRIIVLTEEALPGHMLALALETLIFKDGFGLREDIIKNVEKGTELVFKRFPEKWHHHIAQRTDFVAREAIKTCELDGDTRSLALAISYTILKLVDDTCIRDAGSVAVLTSLAIQSEAQEDGEIWEMNEMVVTNAASKILNRLRMLGYFLKEGVDKPRLLN